MKFFQGIQPWSRNRTAKKFVSGFCRYVNNSADKLWAFGEKYLKDFSGHLNSLESVTGVIPYIYSNKGITIICFVI